jgi:hypothetical protein
MFVRKFAVVDKLEKYVYNTRNAIERNYTTRSKSSEDIAKEF